MPKFFVMNENIKDNEIIINSEDVLHIKKVLRLGIGDKLKLCDGKGYDYETKISSVKEKEIVCEILEKTKSNTEPNIEVTLIQGIPKASKMDYIIQKTTELGVVKIVPCEMSRCVVKLDSKKDGMKKQQRWQKIAEEAAKQSGRGVVPKVSMPCTIDEAIDIMKNSDLSFAPYECEEEKSIKGVLLSNKNVKTVSFMIGPEGGYDASEIKKLQDANIPTITLGKRILRTETAGEAVLSMIMYEIGDINNI